VRFKRSGPGGRQAAERVRGPVRKLALGHGPRALQGPKVAMGHGPGVWQRAEGLGCGNGVRAWGGNGRPWPLGVTLSQSQDSLECHWATLAWGTIGQCQIAWSAIWGLVAWGSIRHSQTAWGAKWRLLAWGSIRHCQTAWSAIGQLLAWSANGLGCQCQWTALAFVASGEGTLADEGPWPGVPLG